MSAMKNKMIAALATAGAIDTLNDEGMNKVDEAIDMDQVNLTLCQYVDELKEHYGHSNEDAVVGVIDALSVLFPEAVRQTVTQAA